MSTQCYKSRVTSISELGVVQGLQKLAERLPAREDVFVGVATPKPVPLEKHLTNVKEAATRVSQLEDEVRRGKSTPQRLRDLRDAYNSYGRTQTEQVIYSDISRPSK